MKTSPQSVIDQYIKTCEILKETTLSGDYRRGNSEGKKIVKLFKILEKDLYLAQVTLPTLFNHDNVVVRTTVAADCLALNIFIDEAIKVLEEISNEQSNGIFGFNAKMTLSVWREQGYLKVY